MSCVCLSLQQLEASCGSCEVKFGKIDICEQDILKKDLGNFLIVERAFVFEYLFYSYSLVGGEHLHYRLLGLERMG